MTTEEAVGAARAFAERAGALRVVLIVDRGDDHAPLMVDCDADGDVEVTDGEHVTLIEDARPGPAPDVRAIPATAISLDEGSGELAAPLGAIEHLTAALAQLAHAAGGRSVATLEIATQDEPITLAVREGEPPVLAAGDREYRLPG